MNKQKNNKNQQEMSQAQSSVTSSTSNTNVTGATSSASVNGQQSLNAKQKASKAEYGTLTAKEDANNDYE